MALIEANNITKSFGSVNVLKGINASIQQGEIVTIVGASGAGKTTFLQIAGTLMRPTSGSVIINQTEVSRLKDKELARFRNKHIGFVFQFHHLLPEFTALENVCIPAFIAGLSKSDSVKKAKEIIGFLGLTHRIEHKPAELSGGEQQRVAVARALINNPDVVLADEPSGNLDSHNKKELHELFFTLRKQYNQTFVIVTHDNELAGMSDRTITMHDGLLA
ncbi:MAG TPA: ABC transporter ATP-binding protein [Bacteroidales bacterium]|nr:ABC transporter ATP-binding protein [Bacteroidales bacterium]